MARPKFATHTAIVHTLTFASPRRVERSVTVGVRLTPTQIVVVNIPADAKKQINGLPRMGGSPDDYRYSRADGNKLGHSRYWSHLDVSTLSPVASTKE